jgi:hypothetical protein
MTFPVCFLECDPREPSRQPPVGWPDAPCHTRSQIQGDPNRLRSVRPLRHHGAHATRRNLVHAEWNYRSQGRSVPANGPSGRVRLQGIGAARPGRLCRRRHASPPEGPEPIAAAKDSLIRSRIRDRDRRTAWRLGPSKLEAGGAVAVRAVGHHRVVRLRCANIAEAQRGSRD